MNRWFLYQDNKEECVKVMDVGFQEVIEVTKTYRKIIHKIGNFKTAQSIKKPWKTRTDRFRELTLCDDSRTTQIKILIDNEAYEKGEIVEFKVLG